MTHSLKYIGITRDALIDAAKYDPPSAELVTALVEALGTESEDTAELETEVDALSEEVEALRRQVECLEGQVEDLKDQLYELETNQETESND